jgi:hypothetical protein
MVFGLTRRALPILIFGLGLIIHPDRLASEEAREAGFGDRRSLEQRLKGAPMNVVQAEVCAIGGIFHWTLPGFD